ncbi:hypothetical protein GCM10018785_42210 [Streptomyces longispororuber]|uniref:HTH luxR-type domain-containing protein n=1 Tax=Streptomyces longispororuber TaxID=68230 RepID=A0A918ZUF7_9ACTN|nr:hypothetical protein GCM10018785_42210 [Streptomyces longispororuber]
MPELGDLLSGLVGQVVPHDGHILFGMDPVTRAGCFGDLNNCYSPQALQRIVTDTARSDSVRDRTGPVRVLTPGMSDPRHSTQLRIMSAEGFASELRIELTGGGRTWGMLILLRAQGSTPFSLTDTAHAAAMSQPLAITLKRFVASTPLGSARSDLPPGLIILGPDNGIRAITPSGREAVRSLTHDRAHDGEEVLDPVWDIAQRARQAGGPVVCRSFSTRGWAAVYAQPLGEPSVGDVAVTIQPAPAEVLLPAITAWYGITPREQTVIERALEGLSVKQIARRLDVSIHTVNDHFKAIYRKTRVTSRNELTASLTH